MKTKGMFLLYLTVILSATVGLYAQDLSDLTLIANYPLSDDGSDITGLQEPMTLINTPFQDGGIYCNGIYLYGGEPGGCHAETPQLDGFNFQKYAVSADIFIVESYTGAGHSVLVGGNSYRWMAVLLDSDDIIGFGYNHEYTITPGAWQTVTVTFDSLAGVARCFLDAVQVDEEFYTGFSHGNERTISITHSGYGMTFKGLFKNLKIYSRPEAVAPDSFAQDSLALVALYNATNGPGWTRNDNWLSGDVSTWYGITVQDGRVFRISLADNNLIGALPAELVYLTGLSGLYLNQNQIAGFIPLFIDQLVQLSELHLEDNRIGNTIPSQICNLPHLTQLILNNNRLAGDIPSDLGDLTHLVYLALNDNLLNGRIPAGLGGCADLLACNLSNNQLTGSLPASIGNWLQMHTLIVDNNQLTGPIPEEIGTCAGLRYLSLTGNQFSGIIPSGLGNCIQLESIYLCNNQFEGPIPASFGNLTACKYLDIYDNRLSGEVPQALTGMANLLSFTCFNNQLTGLPDFSGISTLRDLTVQSNNFTFEDIEPNLSIPEFYYSPQDSVGEKIDTVLTAGGSLTMTVNVGGTANEYQWKKDGLEIEGAFEAEYIILSANAADAGAYSCVITNTLATALTLASRPVHVTVTGSSSDIPEQSIPRVFALNQNFPNPFNPSTHITFLLPLSGHIVLKVYDIQGREMETLVNGFREAGQYSITWNAGNLASGIYFCRLEAGGNSQIRKLLIQK